MTARTHTPVVRTLAVEVPGARLHVEVRGRGPLLLLTGAPMDADAFAPLADRLATDRTVITHDPRGIHRSPVADPDADSTPQQRGDDLAHLLRHLDAGPAHVVGSSGGASSALALVQQHPGLVDLVVVHEPPLDRLLPDRDRLAAETRQIVAAYDAGDVVGAWTLFMASADIDMAPEVVAQVFGPHRDPQQLADEQYQFLHMLTPTNDFAPDLEVLRSVDARIVVGVGEESAGQVCERSSLALAAALGAPVARFPGGHIGFTEDPGAFARRLLDVLG